MTQGCQWNVITVASVSCVHMHTDREDNVSEARDALELVTPDNTSPTPVNSPTLYLDHHLGDRSIFVQSPILRIPGIEQV